LLARSLAAADATTAIDSRTQPHKFDVSTTSRRQLKPPPAACDRREKLKLENQQQFNENCFLSHLPSDIIITNVVVVVVVDVCRQQHLNRRITRARNIV